MLKFTYQEDLRLNKMIFLKNWTVSILANKTNISIQESPSFLYLFYIKFDKKTK